VRVTASGLNKAAQQRARAGVNGKPNATQIHERLDRLRQFRWSSYRAYIGLADRPRWLTIQAVLASDGTASKAAQRQHYRQ